MSLFASAFDSPSVAGPSSLSAPNLGKAHKDGNKKRKRSSLGNGPDKIKSTEANFQRLMKKVDGGEVKEKSADGGGMDHGGKSKKNKNKGGGEVVMKGKGARDRAAQKSLRPKDEDRDSDQGESAFDSKVTKKKEKKTKEQEPRPISYTADGKPMPAELPLPHDTPKASRKSRGDDSLTDMQRSMQAKLEGARFRWINEQLYSNPSTEAVAMMKKDPKIFEDYHQTHRALTSAWPSPPLPHFIALLSPLPAKTVIVDLGCGDAGLARELVPQGKVVMSYDLVGDSGSPGQSAGSGGWVVEADFLEGVPLPGRPGGLSAQVEEAGEEGLGRRGKKGKSKAKGKEASEVVDVVVCCLSLMGVNWIGGIYEACRILKEGGTFHIAEVTSRFISIPTFITAVESFGFKLQSQASPSTHFTLFHFIKEAAVPLGPARGEEGWGERLKEGERILRGCVYKKR